MPSDLRPESGGGLAALAGPAVQRPAPCQRVQHPQLPQQQQVATDSRLPRLHLPREERLPQHEEEGVPDGGAEVEDGEDGLQEGGGRGGGEQVEEGEGLLQLRQRVHGNLRGQADDL